MRKESSQLVAAKLKDLRPTQITVGLRAVKAIVEEWRGMKADAREQSLSRRWFPAVLGPGGDYYITDHHHHGLALLQCGVKEVFLIVMKDLSALEHKPFWMAMDHHNWVHPYNAKGQRDEFSAIPKKLRGLADDPYRSLADQVEKLGGCAKTHACYEEFLWADYFRSRIALKKKSDDWDAAVSLALVLARDREAKYLPGWCGPSG